MRHGIAMEREVAFELGLNDDLRELTAKGRETSGRLSPIGF